ncbi:MAG: hypothetical protein GF392_06370 [Candidatus Omnitrophica bacterium]|nr:hypothetical protein [Candidatus Omnitrophota bacterium]
MKDSAETITITGSLMTISFVVTCLLFDTPFSSDYIDWISYGAALFLVADGIINIKRHGNDSALSIRLRVCRIFIGCCVFTIHLIQQIWGIDSPIFRIRAVEVAIDWSAFLFGVFLIVEGIYRILLSGPANTARQITRFIRILTGSVVFTIHLLQFMRY